MNRAAKWTTDKGRMRHENPKCHVFYQHDTVEKTGQLIPKSPVREATPEEMASKPVCSICAGTAGD